MAVYRGEEIKNACGDPVGLHLFPCLSDIDFGTLAVEIHLHFRDADIHHVVGSFIRVREIIRQADQAVRTLKWLVNYLGNQAVEPLALLALFLVPHSNFG